MPFPSIKKVKKSWYLSSTCPSLGFAELLFHRFLLLGVLLKSVETSFIFDFHATRFFKITFLFLPFWNQIWGAPLFQVWLCFLKAGLVFSFSIFFFNAAEVLVSSFKFCLCFKLVYGEWCCLEYFFLLLFFQLLFWCQCYDAEFVAVCLDSYFLSSSWS